MVLREPVLEDKAVSVKDVTNGSDRTIIALDMTTEQQQPAFDADQPLPALWPSVTAQELTEAREQLGLSPVEMSRAMGISYQTYKHWQAGRNAIPPLAVRCVELLMIYPRTAKRLAQRGN